MGERTRTSEVCGGKLRTSRPKSNSLRRISDQRWIEPVSIPILGSLVRGDTQVQSAEDISHQHESLRVLGLDVLTAVILGGLSPVFRISQAQFQAVEQVLDKCYSQSAGAAVDGAVGGHRGQEHKAHMPFSSNNGVAPFVGELRRSCVWQVPSENGNRVGSWVCVWEEWAGPTRHTASNGREADLSVARMGKERWGHRVWQGADAALPKKARR
jgi:hypothetical protein